jgi:phosphate transport system substrate-binding protein
MSLTSLAGCLAPDRHFQTAEDLTVTAKLTIATLSAVVLAGIAAPAAEARNQIRIVGSSTVYPFTTAVAEQYARNNPKFRAPIVESTGTGGGMKIFCSGIGPSFPDMTNASRRIKASEVKQCMESGVTKIVELQVGLDGLALAHSKGSADFGLSLRDLYAALAANPWGKGANKAKTWKDVNAKLPADKIELIGPPPTSGTRDSFNELMMEAGCNTNPAMAALKKSDEAKYKQICTKIREDGAYIEAGENDNLIVQKLASNPKAIGAFGYSFLEENMDKLKGVAVNGVQPNIQTVQSGKYPASRSLFIYIKAQHVGAIPGMREFVNEYAKESTWGPRGYLVRRGLVPSTDADRSKYASTATGLTLLDPKTVK